MNELKLTLLLLIGGKEIPPNIKEKAIEQLKLFSMEQESGSAEAYFADQLLKAIEEGDAELAEQIGDMIAALNGDGDPFGDGGGHEDGEPIEPTVEIEEMIRDCISAYIDEVEDPSLKAARFAVIDKLHDAHDLIPLHYDNGMLVGFGQHHRSILVYFLNRSIGKDEAVDRYEGTVDNDALTKAIMDQWSIDHGTIEVEFLHLDVKIFGEGKLRIMTRPV